MEYNVDGQASSYLVSLFLLLLPSSILKFVSWRNFAVVATDIFVSAIKQEFVSLILKIGLQENHG